MDGLRTGRVLILENDETAALALLRALAVEGIGAVLVTGDDKEVEAVSQRPLHGIRVVFADMDLREVGGSEEAIVGHTIQVLTSILAPDSEPLVIVTWSVHQELVSSFEKAIKEQPGELQPLVLRDLKHKEDLIESPDEQLVAAVLEELKGLAPLTLLWHWEQQVHEAATATTHGLAKLIDRPAIDERWLIRLRRVLASLGLAAGGQTIQNDEDGVVAVLESLNPLHEDRLDELSRANKYEGDPELLEAIQKDRDAGGKQLDEPARRLLNRMLLLQPEPAAGRSAAPGCIYLRGAWDGDFPIGEGDQSGPRGMSHFELLEHTLNDWPDGNEARAALAASHVPMLVELTPVCDHSQAKAPYTRLAAGLLVPADQKHEITSKEYVRTTRAFTLDPVAGAEIEGDYVLAINALMLVTLPREELSKQTPVCRLRSPLLGDVQAWFGSHAGRPGIISLDGG